MKTAVVILNYNGRHYLEKFLPDVIKFSGSADVIVADNASTDDSVAFLAEHYPELRLIVLDKNYGFAEGYNRALSQVDSEYFVLLNSDVLVTPDWLTTMESYLDSNVDNYSAVICSARRAGCSDGHRKYKDGDSSESNYSGASMDLRKVRGQSFWT